MKRIAAILILVALVGLCVGRGSVSAATAKIRLTGKTIDLSSKIIEISNQAFTLEGKAHLAVTYASTTIKTGTMRLESMSAEKIDVELARDAKGGQSPSKVAAIGGVIMKAKRADEEANRTDGPVTIFRDVHATAQTATTESLENLVLKGNVVVKIMEPGIAEPVAVISGETVRVSLKDNKIRVEGQSDKPAELTVTSKEGEEK